MAAGARSLSPLHSLLVGLASHSVTTMLFFQLFKSVNPFLTSGPFYFCLQERSSTCSTHNNSTHTSGAGSHITSRSSLANQRQRLFSSRTLPAPRPLSLPPPSVSRFCLFHQDGSSRAVSLPSPQTFSAQHSAFGVVTFAITMCKSDR